MSEVLASVASSAVVEWAFLFVAMYPLCTSAMWVATAVVFSRQRERGSDDGFYDIPDRELPFVSVVVPAFRESAAITPTLQSLCNLDYPRYEILVVDDGSPDGTSGIVRRYARVNSRIRVLCKEVNEGKAMAMNDALPIVRGEVVVVLDADARMRPDALRYIVPHFVRLPRVGAVTGNPRVGNRTNLVCELQTLEFTSIISLIRRAQVVWGRIMTVSGVISAFRVSALREVGLFDPSKATEDIDISWRLQRSFYDVRYEPRALVDMTVPSSWTALWQQRRRWTTGLAQVLRGHADVLRSWRMRRLWVVYLEAACSVLWAHVFMAIAALWVVCVVAGAPPPSMSVRPSVWGASLALASVLQLSAGVHLDAKYDETVKRSLLLAPVYPLVYWTMMAVVTVRSTLPALLRTPPPVALWSTVRAGSA
ncbi:MAG TPA: glycosyltransferase family 2 protein [Mycobacteriales bacterium]|nr:glycosyltransferase family 2 protein [Mycobacteriales bacterium]